jgi:hypothetical protein
LCCWWLTGCSQLSWSHNETLPTPTTHNGVVDEQYYQELVAYNAYVDAQLTYVATVLQKVPKPQNQRWQQLALVVPTCLCYRNKHPHLGFQ